ncbi:TRAFs-binding domain-containing protein [Pontibacter sp. 13R65]|uniref:toll/interleukin-1 receptor domain-containing protein n=1 Tax=Pontibacter sp. 13R65 TaxID=3127458 RepID=UPI00301D3AEF
MIPAEWLKYAPKPRPLGKGEEWNVFLSYRSVNRTWVLSLYDILVELGYRVFIDQCELVEGETLIMRLEEALGKSQAGILIWSEAAANSKWVLKEYARLETKATKNEAFCFVPIKLDKAPLPEFADSKIFVDFSSYPDGPNGGELIRLVHGIVGKPLDAATVKFANEQNEASMDAARAIDAAVRIGDPEHIIELSDSNTLPWRTTPSLGCKAAESLIKLKMYPEAISILEKLEDRFPKAVRPKQLHALALARTGTQENLKQAQRILSKLYEQGERDPETLGIFARTWMDRYNLSQDIKYLDQSRKYYAEAFERVGDDYYTGLNAAAKSVLLGTAKDIQLADDYAQRTLTLVGTSPWANDYWKTATVAELLLIKKLYSEAGEMYAEAVRIEPESLGNHESTRNQAVKLLAKLGATESEKAEVLNAFKHISS